MNTKVELLKQLALKITTATSIKQVTGETTCEVLDYIVKNFKEPVAQAMPTALKLEKNTKEEIQEDIKDKTQEKNNEEATKVETENNKDTDSESKSNTKATK